ncbi:MAG: response regulator [Actinomycetia bacterium]|nr:response regulator [Actinomycetes bacterium]
MRAVRVLLEADDDELRAVLGSALRRDGYDVTVCRDGDALVDHLLAISEPSDFDLIVATIHDRSFNALQMLERGDLLRNCPPLILLTEIANESTRRLSERLGAPLFDREADLVDLMTQVRKLAPTARDLEEQQ